MRSTTSLPTIIGNHYRVYVLSTDGRIICELANGPTTPEADLILAEGISLSSTIF